MQIICKFLTSQKEANDALGPKGSLGSRKQQGRERKEGIGGDQEGSGRPGGPCHFRECPAWPCVRFRNVGRGAG